MYLADYHTHTQFSPDAQDSMTAMAQAAIRAGLDEICFTDHVEPMEWGTTKLRGPYDWTLLTRDFRAAQAALGDQIQLRLGMELGDAQWAPEHVAKLLEGAPEFDFIIGSIHLLSRRYGSQDLYVFSPKDESEAQEARGDYLEEALALAATEKLGLLFGGVDLLEDGTVCEVNSTAHLVNLKKCTGIDTAPLLFRAIQEALQ